MKWDYIKEKILAFSEGDYVFADMFISIINEYNGVQNQEDLKLYTYAMLKELMDENLIKIYILYLDKMGNLKKNIYNYHNEESKKVLINIIDDAWKNKNYSLPLPNELFWITEI